MEKRNLKGLMSKACNQCHINLPTECFSQNIREQDGIQRTCKQCQRFYRIVNANTLKVKQAAKHKKRWASGKSREYHLRKTFGITLEQYNAMRDSQGGVCAICLKPQNNAKQKNLGVDHNHVTGKVRGLLCQNCNAGIGLLADNPDVAARAIEYLQKHGTRNSEQKHYEPFTFCG